MKDLKANADSSLASGAAPVFFFGHGNPMNALESNSYTQTLSALSKNFKKPDAILSISAHWLTQGTWVTAMENPQTIHDFYGFPQALFDVNYPAPGSPLLAKQVRTLFGDSPRVELDERNWGLDHGTWSVLRHLFPAAEIPVVQLSLDLAKGPVFHFEMGRKLKSLRSQNIWIIGSGNITHNLRRIDWDMNAKSAKWAIEFDEWVKAKLQERDEKALIEEYLDSESGKLSVPTADHYFPMLCVLGASDPQDELTFEFEGMQNASISMRSFFFRSKT